MQFGKLLKSTAPCEVVVLPLQVLMVEVLDTLVMAGEQMLIVLSSPVVMTKVSGFGVTVIMILVVSQTPLLQTTIQAVSLPTKLAAGV